MVPVVNDVLELQVFDSELGLFLLVWQEDLLVRLQYGSRAGGALQELLGAGNKVVSSPSLLMRR